MAKQVKRIVIVGGVAGGASAATRARRMDEHAEIILFEKDEHVSFANCGLPYYIGGEIKERAKLLVATPELFRKRFRIDVRTRQEITSIDRQKKVVFVLNHVLGQTEEVSYDQLILAPGASPIVPPIDGVKSENVFTLRNLHDTDRIVQAMDQFLPKRAVVVGAGFIGLEMVEQLVHRGLHVSLVELQPQVLPLMDAEMAQPLAQALKQRGVNLCLGDGIDAIEVDGSRATGVKLVSGKVLPSDLVVIGIGVRPNVQLAKDASLSLGETGGIRVNAQSQTDDPNIYAVGDAVEYWYAPGERWMRVPLAGPANRAGRLAGEHAATGDSPPMPSVMGTSIVRVFEEVAAMTGLTTRTAARWNIPAQSVTVIAKDHAGYYPGATPITLKLIYHATSGKILGAQATGQKGVDKRIDVIATAMQFGGTVHQLAGVDLAYAPPFGSAKDPVHMAAFAAINELMGLMPVKQPWDDLSSYQVVDVRSEKEVAAQPLAGHQQSINIPLDTLRDRLDELDSTRETVVSCASGLRSYIATRILKQQGFEKVYNLVGASTMRQRAVDAGMLNEAPSVSSE